MSSYTRQQLEAWLKTIDVAGSCLDIGGSQNPIKGRTKSWNVSDYKILDLEQPHECKQKPDLVADIEKMIWFTDKGSKPNDVGIFEMQKYNNAFCLEVLEYVIDPKQVILNISNFLKEDGILYLSTHFIYPVHPPYSADSLRYTPDGIERLLRFFDFDILENIPRKTKIVNLREVWATEQMRGWKDYDNTIIGSLIKARKR